MRFADGGTGLASCKLLGGRVMVSARVMIKVNVKVKVKVKVEVKVMVKVSLSVRARVSARYRSGLGSDVEKWSVKLGSDPPYPPARTPLQRCH